MCFSINKLHCAIYSICCGHIYAFRKETGMTVTALTVFLLLDINQHQLCSSLVASLKAS